MHPTVAAVFARRNLPIHNRHIPGHPCFTDESLRKPARILNGRSMASYFSTISLNYLRHRNSWIKMAEICPRGKAPARFLPAIRSSGHLMAGSS